VLTRPDKVKLHTLLGSYPNVIALKDGRVKSDLVEFDFADVMARVARAQNRELTGMPVGQVVGMMDRVRPVRDVVQQLVEEYIEACERLEKLNG